MKKFITGALAAFAAAALMTALPASAETIGRDEYGIPLPVETDKLYHTDYTGVFLMFRDNCYIVEESITLKHSATLPQNSMLVVRDGATVKIPDGITLTVKGAMLVHDKAKVNVMSGGSLVVRDTSTSVVNGTLAVSKGGSAEIGGYVQGGTVNVKGKLTVNEGGTMIYSRKKIYPYAEVSGELTRARGIPEYMILELEETENKPARFTDKASGESAVTEDADICRDFETILYKYSGEMELPENMELDEYLKMLEYDCTVEFETESGTITVGTNAWNGIPIIDSADGELKGRFYSAVMGNKPDVSITYVYPFWNMQYLEPVENTPFRGAQYQQTPGLEWYFVDEDNNVTTLSGKPLLTVSGDIDMVVQRIKLLEYLGVMESFTGLDIYIENGEVYRCGRDKILVLWHPLAHWQRPDELIGREYDENQLYVAVILQEIK